MNAREAATLAKDYARDLFAPEGLIDPRMEEVEFDEASGVWNVTVGLLRPLRDQIPGALAIQLAAIRGEETPGVRVQKVVRLRDVDRHFLSVKIRDEVG